MMARLTAGQRRQGRQRRSSKRSKGKERGLHRLSVQKPICTPAKAIIMQALEPYGVKVHRYFEHPMVANPLDYARLFKADPKEFPGFLPIATQANVWVSEAQANWAEYLLERTQRLVVVDGSVNGKNRQWAGQHGGEMPRPWVEKSCKEGQEIWQQVKQIRENNR